LLPIAGVAVALYGVYRIMDAYGSGWYWVAAGTLLVLADTAVDWIWARPAVAKSDEPNLNRRGAELVGQVVMVEEPIEAEGAARCARPIPCGRPRASQPWSASACASSASRERC
jgi:membrane protein implicated in regulation of membrane protease activity